MRKHFPCFVVAIVTFTLIYSYCKFQNLGTPLALSEPRYVELSELITLELTNGWVVSNSPRLPGPYKITDNSGRPCLMHGEPVRGLNCKIVNDFGEIIEEAKLKTVIDIDQMVIYLDTSNGNRTLAVLNRKN